MGFEHLRSKKDKWKNYLKLLDSDLYRGSEELRNISSLPKTTQIQQERSPVIVRLLVLDNKTSYSY